MTARLIAVACLILAASLPAASPAASQESGPPAVRNVTPPGMTPGPVVDGPLIREETPPPPPEAARWRRFLLPRTTDSATFMTEGLAIRVSGVTPPPADKVCEASNGETWPCGRVALFSLRMFLRGRPVECYFPPLGDVRQVIAPCRVGTTDLGLWLLAQGWAEPDGNATDDYRKASEEARCARRGLFRDAPSDGTCPAGD